MTAPVELSDTSRKAADEVLQLVISLWDIDLKPAQIEYVRFWFEVGGRDAIFHMTREQNRELDRRMQAARDEESKRLVASAATEAGDGLDESLKSLLHVWVGNKARLDSGGVQGVLRDHESSPSVGAPGAATPGADAPIVGDQPGVVPSATPGAPSCVDHPAGVDGCGPCATARRVREQWHARQRYDAALVAAATDRADGGASASTRRRSIGRGRKRSAVTVLTVVAALAIWLVAS